VILRSYQFAVEGTLDVLLEQIFQGFETLGRLLSHRFKLDKQDTRHQHAHGVTQNLPEE